MLRKPAIVTVFPGSPGQAYKPASVVCTPPPPPNDGGGGTPSLPPVLKKYIHYADRVVEQASTPTGFTCGASPYALMVVMRDPASGINLAVSLYGIHCFPES